MPLPLSFAQERLWFLHQLVPSGPLYNMPVALRITGPLDSGVLALSLGEIVRRHEALRTVFAVLEGSPVQVIQPLAPFALALVDLARLPECVREPLALTLVGKEAGRPFDLSRGPLLRGMLLRLAEEDHVVALTLHHIVGDGWSLEIFVRDFTALYTAFADGRPSPLPELVVQYADFAVWQRSWLQGEVLEEEIAFWRRQLAGLPPRLELPTDRPRPAVQSFHGASRRVRLSAGLVRQLRVLGRHEGATLFMVLLAGFKALLARYSGQEDLAVGAPVAGRNRAEIEGLIGFFVNTLVLRGDLSGGPVFRELLARVRETALAAYAHQDVPFEKLVEELSPQRSLAHTPLFQAMFVLQNAPFEELEIRDLCLRPLSVGVTAAKFELTLSLSEWDGGLTGTVEYVTDLFDAPTLERMMAHLECLLAAALATPERPMPELPLLSETELGQILIEWNDTAPESAPRACLHELFEEQVRSTPEAVALVAGTRELRYGELDRAADRLAGHMRHYGVGPEGVVGVCLERSADMVIALLAILKAGAAYLPLDPRQPRPRLGTVLASASLVVSNHDLAAGLPWSGPLILVDHETEWSRGGAGGPGYRPDPENLAYVLHTSGSTGTPKGIAVTHRSAVALVRWAGTVYGPEELAGVLAATSLSFDLSVFELFVPLCRGGTVILAKDVLDLSALPARGRVTLVNTVPSAMSELVHAGSLSPSVRTVNLAGEPLQRSLAEQIYATGAVERVWNLYGPSEDTTYSTFSRVPREGSTEPGIGRPIAATKAHVLSRMLTPVPIGVVGELWLGGAGLARGYLGRPDLTAERFLPDPFGAESGARLYRTGDLVRWLADGTLEFLGRLDHQVKVRGFRIELGEIEAALASLAGVREAVVTAREEASGDRRLVAYVVGEVAADALRESLRERLPDYMVPATFVTLAALPLTPNGKVDRKALPAPEWQGDARSYVAPRTPVEEVLAGIWTGLLGLERVGAADHFFDLGGHSLLATRLVSRLRTAFNVELPVRDLFEAPTLAALAARVAASMRTGARPPAPPLVPVPREMPLPLSFAQERLWFLHQLDPGSPAYNLSYWVELEGPLSWRALERSLAEILRRHEALRTTFPTLEGEPFQVVAPDRDLTLPLVDLTRLEDVNAEVERLAVEEAGEGFDLWTGPLARFRLLRTREERHHLLCTLDHIVADGWSMGILLRELAALYTAFAEDRPSPLPGLEVQYADFAAWQRERWNRGELRGQLEFWRERLAGLPPLELPADGWRDDSGRPRAAIRPLTLTPELSSAVAGLGRRQGTTRFMSLLAALQALLGRLSDQEDFAVGSPVASREHPGIEGLIGFFVNTLVLRCDLSDDPPFATHLERVRAAALGAYQNQELPFEKLVEELQPERRFGQTPLFQVLFVFQGELPRVPPTPSLRWTFHPPLSTVPKFDLSIAMQEEKGRVTGFVEYRVDLFSPAAIQRLCNGFQTLLTAAVNDPQRRIGDLPLLAPSELEEVLATGRGAASPYPREATLPELFGEWVENTPDAVALSWSEGILTYRELDRRANRVAWRLRELGIGPEVPVALCAERSPGLVVGMLGILKAGGFYVPLDPDYPEERLAFMLEDSGAPVLLRLEHLVGRLPGSTAREVVLTLEGEVWESGDPAAGETAPPAGTSAGNLAYVMYTSGSTGRPKGVSVMHRGIVRLVRGADYAVFDSSQTLLQTSTPSFDAATFEIWGALLNGGRLALMPPGIPSPAELTAVMVRHGVTSMMLTAALFHQLAEHGLGGIPSLRQALSAGDVLAPAAMRRAAADLPGCRIVNAYGPTENTVLTCCYELNDPEELGASVPLGGSIANTRVYILDRHLQPLPAGVPGELFAAGDGLARGYWRRPILSAERFLPDPWSPKPGGRMYRTGDRVRFTPAGEVELLGRLDHQVKVRGFRIEPGEIEGVLLQHPAVRDAVVKPYSHESGGDKYLVAYVGAEGEELPASGDLRAFLGSRLPAYMVPAWFVVLRELPLTPNAKVDRGALQLPRDFRESSRAPFVAPRSMVEQMIADIWARALRLERVGVFDSFFELGGHSLNATQVVSKLREELEIEVPLRTLFQAPTVADLAVALLRQMAEEAGEDALILDSGEPGEPASRAAVQTPLGES
jgi:amino acid adenylation domain-containing protein